MDNRRIAQVFSEIADLLEIKGANAFRIRAYRTAADTGTCLYHQELRHLLSDAATTSAELVAYLRERGPGETKSSVRLVPPESRGAAMQYFTGSKAHNIVLRDRAIQRGFKLNEYGLFRTADEARGS